MDEISRVIGALEATQQAQKEQHAALAERVDRGFADMNGKLDQLLADRQRQKGARKLAGIAATGVGSVVGGVVTGLVTWWATTKQP
jgi:flavin-dependent dehydrogenase